MQQDSNQVIERRARAATLVLGPLLLTAFTAPIVTPTHSGQPAITQVQSHTRVIAQPSISRPISLLTTLAGQSVPNAEYSIGLDDVLIPPVEFIRPLSVPAQAVLLSAPVFIPNPLSVPFIDYALESYFPPPPPDQIGVNYGHILSLFTFDVAPPPPPDVVVNYGNLAPMVFSVMSEAHRAKRPPYLPYIEDVPIEMPVVPQLPAISPEQHAAALAQVAQTLALLPQIEQQRLIDDENARDEEHAARLLEAFLKG